MLTQLFRSALCVFLFFISLASASTPNGCPYIELGSRAVLDTGQWGLPVQCSAAGHHGNATHALILLNPHRLNVPAQTTSANGTSTFLLGITAIPGLYKCIQSDWQPVSRCPSQKAKVYVTREDIRWAISEARHDSEVQQCQVKVGAGQAERQEMVEEIVTLRKMLNESCLDVQRANGRSGLYTIYPGRSPVTVYCDQDTVPGGWAVIQRRVDGTVDFFRNWTEYKNGFGNLTHEFWLGLDNIHALTYSGIQTLRVELTDWSLHTGWSEYNRFSVAGETDKYRLSVGGYNTNSTAGDSMTTTVPYMDLNNMRFSTYDSDNDWWPRVDCAGTRHGAWWFRACGAINLNGRYKLRDLGDFDAISWFSWGYDWRPLKHVQMKVRPHE